MKIEIGYEKDYMVRILGMIMIVQPVCAQNKVTEQQKKEYEKGNRDRNFLYCCFKGRRAD